MLAFWVGDATTIAEEREGEVCVHCYRFILLATLMTYDHHITSALSAVAVAP